MIVLKRILNESQNIIFYQKNNKLGAFSIDYLYSNESWRYGFEYKEEKLFKISSKRTSNPNGENIYFVYDDNLLIETQIFGRLDLINDFSEKSTILINTILNYEYNAKGLISKIVYEGTLRGQSESYFYDDRDNLIKVNLKTDKEEKNIIFKYDTYKNPFNNNLIPSILNNHNSNVNNIVEIGNGNRIKKMFYNYNEHGLPVECFEKQDGQKKSIAKYFYT